MIQKYIKELLHEYNCVVLPSLGGFITQYISADIHPVTLKITPPAKEIAFNELLGNDDGILITYISRDMQISLEQAEEMVKEFVENTKNNLQKFNVYLIEGIGKLFYNTSNKIEFLPELESNFLEDSFGLGEIFLKPVEQTYNAMDKIPPKSSRPPLRRRPLVKKEEAKTKELKKSKSAPEGDQENRIMKPAILWGIVMLVLFVSSAVLYMNKDNKSLASILPSFSGRQTNKENLSSRVVSPTNTTETANIENVANVTVAKTQKYYVVIGSFSAEANAKKLVDKTTSSGVLPTVINPESNEFKYRVSIAEFADKAEARASLKNFKAKYGNGVWVLTK